MFPIKQRFRDNGLDTLVACIKDFLVTTHKQKMTYVKINQKTALDKRLTTKQQTNKKNKLFGANYD